MMNDGSTDHTGAIADALASHDSCLHVIHKPSGGVSSAQNVGINAAYGRYLLFVDSADTVVPRYLYGSGVFNYVYSHKVCVANNIHFDETWLLHKDAMFNYIYMLFAQHIAAIPEPRTTNTPRTTVA